VTPPSSIPDTRHLTPDPMPRVLQVDADAFYVQVARLLDPDGAGRAEQLLVGGSPQGRGVVTSASYATRRFGVPGGASGRKRPCRIANRAVGHRSTKKKSSLARWAIITSCRSVPARSAQTRLRRSRTISKPGPF